MSEQSVIMDTMKLELNKAIDYLCEKKYVGCEFMIKDALIDLNRLEQSLSKKEIEKQ